MPTLFIAVVFRPRLRGAQFCVTIPGFRRHWDSFGFFVNSSGKGAHIHMDGCLAADCIMLVLAFEGKVEELR